MLKRIVVITPGFFHLDALIHEELKNYAEEVVEIIERSDRKLAKIILRLNLPLLSNVYRERRFEYIYKKSQIADQLLIFNPEVIRQPQLDKLRKISTEIKIYLWDSTLTKPSYVKLAQCSHAKIFTFDYADSLKYGWTYLPLFGTSEVHNTFESKRKGISFIGTLYGNRLRKIQEISRVANEHGIIFTAHLYCKTFLHLAYYKFLNFGRSNSLNITRQKATRDFLNQNLIESKYVLDLSNDDQAGMSFRTFEALSNGCILITDNNQALKEFKDDPNVQSIDWFTSRQSVKKSAINFNDTNTYHDYHISNFISKLIK